MSDLNLDDLMVQQAVTAQDTLRLLKEQSQLENQQRGEQQNNFAPAKERKMGKISGHLLVMLFLAFLFNHSYSCIVHSVK